MFLFAVGTLFFSCRLSLDAQFLTRLARSNPHREENMADVKVPQRLDPQDRLKWLMALRRAWKARTA